MSDLLISTRDPERIEVGYSDALLNGLAPDGGLYTLADYPEITEEMLRELGDVTYEDLFTHVKGLFIGDMPAEVQADNTARAYSTDKFDAPDGNIVPVTEVDQGFLIQNLSLGPTAAFKDMALQPLAQDIEYVLRARQTGLVMLGATSGDTGSAAEAAFKGLGTVGMVILSPEVGMSDFQKAQMGELTGDNIANISIRGNFDACQALVKALKDDEEFSRLGAVNSINWGRIASQIPYYVSGYLQAVERNIGDPVDFVAPTGNFGNILAGYIAREMGLPIRRLIAATNENSVVDQLIQTGEYVYRPSEITSSPSMDISQASNYERLLFDILGGDAKRVADYMTRFALNRRVDFNEFGLEADALKRLNFDSGVSTHADRLDSIRWVRDQSGQVIDPHTADAVTVARRKAESGVPIVCMSTALPVKFEGTIGEALDGFVPPRSPRFEGLEQRVQGGFELLDDDAQAVKRFVGAFAGSLGMQGYLAR